MLIVKINKKVVKIIILIVLAGSFAFNIYGYKQNMELANKYELLTHITSQLDKNDLIAFLASANVQTQRYDNIEIFDITKEAVIKTIQSNAAIQKEAASYLKGITNIYVKFKPIPDKGYMIKIPLEPSVKVQNQWLNDFVNEVIIIFPEQEKPYLMVFENGNRPLFLTFEGDTDVLLKNLNFNLQ